MSLLPPFLLEYSANFYRGVFMISKKNKILFLYIILTSLLSGCSLSSSDFTDEYGSEHFNFNSEFYTEETSSESGAYSDEMKIEKSSEGDLDINAGADLYERNFDSKDSIYYNNLNFYNMRTKGSLKILHNFKTYQQTCEYSSGEACILTVLEKYGKKGDYTEKKLRGLIDGKTNEKTASLKQIIDIYNKIGNFKLYTTFDVINAEKELGSKIIAYSNYFNKDFIIKNIEKNIPITICINEAGVQWFNIIGYDDMGTENIYDDVIIRSDSYDVMDHNQDGYSIMPALRLFSNFSADNFFNEADLNDYLFITAVPE